MPNVSEVVRDGLLARGITPTEAEISRAIELAQDADGPKAAWKAVDDEIARIAEQHARGFR